MAVCNKGITQFYLPPTHKPYLPLLPSHTASPPFGRYQLVLLGEQRHIVVRNMPRVFTPRARPRLEPTTSWSQVRYSTNSATTPPSAVHFFDVFGTSPLCVFIHGVKCQIYLNMLSWFYGLKLLENSVIHAALKNDMYSGRMISACNNTLNMVAYTFVYGARILLTRRLRAVFLQVFCAFYYAFVCCHQLYSER